MPDGCDRVETSLRLVVGLGNPGTQYERTRHNVGFWFVDEVAARHRVAFRDERRFHGAVATLDWNGGVVYLLKPSTFMNQSGRAVAAVTKFFKIEPPQILVVHDELDLPPGVVRLKRGGGHGGHNGLRDLIACLGAADFYRLRFGIGHPGDRSAVIRYVLDGPLRSEGPLLQKAIGRAISLLPGLLEGRFGKVMSELHATPVGRTEEKD